MNGLFDWMSCTLIFLFWLVWLSVEWVFVCLFVCLFVLFVWSNG